MNKVKITAIRQTVYPDLMAKYENPISSGFPSMVNVQMECVRRHGNPCVSSLNNLLKVMVISMMDG